MNNIFGTIIIGTMVLAGVIPTLYILVSLPAIIIWKIFRKIRYGCKITD